MKTLTTLITAYVQSARMRSNVRTLVRLIVLLIVIIAGYSALFHVIMAREGQTHSWLTGFYWTMVAMSTLGFGDITFQSDLGRMFSVLVLTTGTIFLLILLPFTFIQFFYAPWLEARDKARAPRELPDDITGHVILTAHGPIDTALIRRLNQSGTPYTVLVADITEALKLHDGGVHVMLGSLDDPDAYRRARVEHAALVTATRNDTTNTNIAVTVREVSSRVPLAALADAEASVDILELAGAQQVLLLGNMLGEFMGRRVFARDGRSHRLGELDDLLIAEAAAGGTALVGRTLRDLHLRDTLGVTVGGVWERGRFTLGGPGTTITPESVLLLAGTRAQLDAYDRAFGLAVQAPALVVILGGGRVGGAAARTLAARGVDYRIVERTPQEAAPEIIAGDAADLAVLQRAGIDRASCALVTTHDDDVNVYLTLYCRRLRPDMLILSRSTLERNATTLHRAGADFVMSYASMGANALYNMLRDRKVLMLAEGLDVFTVPVPAALAGRTIGECGIRQDTGCNLLAIRQNGDMAINPDIETRLPSAAQLVLIGDREAESRFFDQYGAR